MGGTGSSGRGHVLITGASTGIGRACALHLAKRGFTLRDNVENTRGSARIIMVGSGAGFFSPPLLAPYSASKHALEAVCDSLRVELKDQNIQTSLLEPGAIQSEIWRKGDESLKTFPEGSAARPRYGNMIDATLKGAGSMLQWKAIPAERVARIVESCLIRRRAPARVLVGLDARMISIGRRWLPDHWLDALLGMTLKLKW